MIPISLRSIFFMLVFLAPLRIANAAVPNWQVLPAASSITFTAIQNNAPVSGQFKNFTGQINFDPADLSGSHVRIVVDIGSVSTSYKDVQDTLKTKDWFDVKLFPEAVFAANRFVKMKDNHYQAEGTLTIRDKTVPLKLDFTLDEFSSTKAHCSGKVILKRTLFGVGSGDWAKTDAIKDEVEVNFIISAVRK